MKKTLPFWIVCVFSVVAEALETGPVSEDNDAVSLGPGATPPQLKEIQAARSEQRSSWPSMPSFSEYDLSLAADYQVLYQYLDDAPAFSSTAGGVARVYGIWDSGESAPGRLVFKAEHRHRLGTDTTPSEQLAAAGAEGISGPTFSDNKAVLTNLYWGQRLAQNRFGYVAGIVDVSDYLDVYGLVNPWTEFNNAAFANNPSIPIPGQGMGAALHWLTNSQFYVMAGFADANANPHRPQDFFDSFFSTAEYFKYVEFGYIGSWHNRWADNTHITLWQVDERKEAGVDADAGFSLSWSQQRGRWLPFARAGYAEKGVGLQQKSLSIGAGYTIGDGGDAIGVGISWGKSANSDRDQSVVEGYYKWHPDPHVMIVPGLQIIIDPSINDESRQLWMANLKARVTF